MDPGLAGRNVLSGMKSGAEFLAEAPRMVGNFMLENVGMRPPGMDLGEISYPEPVEATLQNVREERERLAEESAAQAERPGVSPALAAASFALPQAAGAILDPTSLLFPGAGRAGRGARELAEAVPTAAVQGVVADAAVPAIAIQAERRANLAMRAEVDQIIPQIRDLPDDALRELLETGDDATQRAVERVTFMRAKGTHAGPPAVGPQVPPQVGLRRPGEALQALPPEALADEPPLPQPAIAGRMAPPAPPPGTARFYHGGVRGRDGGPAWLSQDKAYAEGYAAKTKGGKVYYIDLPEDSPLLVKMYDDSGTSMVAPYKHFEAPPEIALGLREMPQAFAGRGAPPTPPRPPAVAGSALPGMEGRLPKTAADDPFTLIGAEGQIRVKGVSNVQGLQDDLRQLAEDNVDLMVATRNAPPVHEQLGMTLDEFVATPAGQIFTPAQLREGGQLLGGLRAEYKALANQFKDLADPAAKEAARAEMARLNAESVNLLAVLQGRGYSQGGRILNEAQRAKTALAQDETMRLRMALIDRYADPAARPAVAQAEAKAMVKLQREAQKDAAYAARKLKRVVTSEELSAEFNSLSSDFGKLAARPRMGLDPDLAVLIGKMAKNRMRAGMNSLEEVADYVYQAVRPHLDTLTPEQVRTSIVSQALKKPVPTGRKMPPKLKSIIPARQQALVARYEAQLSDDVIEQIAMLPDDPADPAFINFIRKMESPTLKDYAGALPYHFMLSGPKTLLRNGLGNTVRRWTDIAMRPLEAVVDIPMAKLAGRPRERYISETLPAIVGSYRGAGKGLERALFVLKNGYDPARLAENLTGRSGGKWAFEGRMPLDPFVLSESKAVRVTGAITGYGPRLLNTADAMAKSRASTSASYAWATRQAIKDVKAGKAADVADRAAQLLQEQPDAMIDFAAQAAGKATFQDEMSRFGRWVSGGRRLEGAPGYIMRRLQPFIHVSDRIGNWLLDFTPAVRGRQIWKLAKEGDATASDLIARQIVGTTVATAAAGWAFQGKLVGAAPKDEKLRNDFYADGKQPYSALISGRWVPIRDLFGGLAGPVVLGAAFHDNMTAGEPIDAEAIAQAAGGAILGEARYLLDASYLEGLSSAVSAIEAEPDQMGRETAALSARLIGGQAVPFSGALRNVAIATDPRVVEKRGFVDELKAGLPGLRQQLPARIGPLGEELRMSTGAAGGFSPLVPTESKVADPNLAEDVGRLRYTVEARRRDLNRIQAQIKDARKAKNAARVAELRKGLPPIGVLAGLDSALTRVRGAEMAIRKLRANKNLTPEQKRRQELAKLTGMQAILARALERLETQ